MNQLPKKTLYLFLVLIGVTALTVFVLWKGFTEPTTELTPTEGVRTGSDFDFSLLETKKVKYLEPYEKLPEFEGEIGRDNPFSPYEVGTTSPEE